MAVPGGAHEQALCMNPKSPIPCQGVDLFRGGVKPYKQVFICDQSFCPTKNEQYVA